MPKGVIGLLGILALTIRGRAQASETSDRLLNRSLRQKKESPMNARKVSLRLKSESVNQFLQKIEHEVTPLFRKQKGFLDQLVIVPDRGGIVYVYTFWERGEDAEKYDCKTLPVLTKLLSGVVDGSLRPHVFGGLRGRLSGE
jgi:hypothetical protein